MLQLRTKGTASGCPRTCRARTFRRHEVVCVAETVSASTVALGIAPLQRVLVRVFIRRRRPRKAAAKAKRPRWAEQRQLELHQKNTAHAQRLSSAAVDYLCTTQGFAKAKQRELGPSQWDLLIRVS
jgi:hypothetical protein